MGKIIELEKGKYMLEVGGDIVHLTPENIHGASNAVVITEKSKVTASQLKSKLKGKHKYVIILGRVLHSKIPTGVPTIFIRKEEKERAFRERKHKRRHRRG